MDVLCTCTARVYRADKEGLLLLLLLPPLPLLLLQLPPPLLPSARTVPAATAAIDNSRSYTWWDRWSRQNEETSLNSQDVNEEYLWVIYDIISREDYMMQKKKNRPECGQHNFINWGAQTEENGKKAERWLGAGTLPSLLLVLSRCAQAASWSCHHSFELLLPPRPPNDNRLCFLNF